jgi:hypothetical protein
VTHSFTNRKLALAAALAGWVCVAVNAQAPGSEQILPNWSTATKPGRAAC